MSNSNSQDKYLSWALENELRPIDPKHYFLYHAIFAQYVEKGIFSLKKNDKSLFNYLQDNQIYINEIDKIIEKLLMTHFELDSIADNILVILDYLKWSYGIEVDCEKIYPSKYKKEPVKHEDNYIVPIKSLGTLRKNLIEKYKKCQVCGMTYEPLFRQSHTKPKNHSKKQGKIEEVVDINNVLLLCPNHDALFDIGDITFDDEGNIMISKRLSEENVKAFGLDKKIKIELNEEQIRYIQYHRENVFEKKRVKM